MALVVILNVYLLTFSLSDTLDAVLKINSIMKCKTTLTYYI